VIERPTFVCPASQATSPAVPMRQLHPSLVTFMSPIQADTKEDDHFFEDPISLPNSTARRLPECRLRHTANAVRLRGSGVWRGRHTSGSASLHDVARMAVLQSLQHAEIGPVGSSRRSPGRADAVTGPCLTWLRYRSVCRGSVTVDESIAVISPVWVPPALADAATGLLTSRERGGKIGCRPESRNRSPGGWRLWACGVGG
jgi:hypothetical protein